MGGGGGGAYVCAFDSSLICVCEGICKRLGLQVVGTLSAR